MADVIASGEEFDTVVTVCGGSNAEHCPLLNTTHYFLVGQRLLWGVPHPIMA